MVSGRDSFSPYDGMLTGPLTDPWTHHHGQPPRYAPNYDLLGRLLTVPITAGAVSESGSFASGIDAWIAQALRRAGFGPDEVWPRSTRPRVLPRDLAVLRLLFRPARHDPHRRARGLRTQHRHDPQAP